MKKNVGFAILLMVVFAATRWPGLMPDNFSAAYAIAFCAGVFFTGAMAWWLPLGTLLASDVAINVFYYDVAPLDVSMAAGYLGFAALIFLGRRFRPESSLPRLLGGSLLGVLIFYLISNSAAWMQLPYQKSLSGWIQALTTGLPGYPPTWTFLRNALLSGGLFTALFAGSVKLTQALDAEEETSADADPEPAEAEPQKQ